MVYYDMPLPAIIGQSVHVVTWIFMVVSAFAAQPWCDHEPSFWYFFQVFYIVNSGAEERFWGWGSKHAINGFFENENFGPILLSEF